MKLEVEVPDLTDEQWEQVRERVDRFHANDHTTMIARAVLAAREADAAVNAERAELRRAIELAMHLADPLEELSYAELTVAALAAIGAAGFYIVRAGTAVTPSGEVIEPTPGLACKAVSFEYESLGEQP